jgi:DNA-binding MarR family transcriptional regulator
LTDSRYNDYHAGVARASRAARTLADEAPPTAAFAAPVRTPRTVSQVQTLLALVEVANRLERDVVELLKGEDLTLTQFNVLRILRGAGPDGATCGQVGERMIRHDPDVTRLLDRLDRRGLIARGRDAFDRRIVRTRVTRKGLELLARLDAPVDDLHERQFGHLSEADLVALRRLAESFGARGRG